MKGCPTCGYLTLPGFCKAFPEGIPVIYTSGQFLHDKIVKGQEGDFIFSEKEQTKSDFNNIIPIREGE